MLLWLAVLIGHVLGAGLWWWVMPGGFPVGHPRFWTNRVFPPVVLGLGVAGIVALHRGRIGRLGMLLPLWPAFWIGASLSGRLVFPITASRLWLVPFVGALGLALTLVSIAGRARPRALAWIARGLALLLGALLPVSQAPPRAGTRPVALALPVIAPPDAPDESPLRGLEILRPGVALYAGDASVSVKLAPLTFTIDPLLRFESRSPDGCWTVFARALDRAPVSPRLRQGARQGAVGRLFQDFPDLGSGALEVDASRDHEVEINAVTRLNNTIFSHLNDYCHITVSGHQRLALEFSPCPGARIEVLPFDYPRGRPARFAYLDAHGMFRVVEARSGEKGPFQTLAEGLLARGEPLSITFHDGNRPVARLTLADWSAQLDTTLSPTAGWGVPANAIEFHRRRVDNSGDPPPSNAPCDLFFSLASTSVGRGWDAVAHAPGTYRNRLRLIPTTP